MSDITPSKLRMFKAILKTFPSIPVITGSQSYWFRYTDFNEIVREASSHVFLFCREKYSYELLRRIVGLFQKNNIHVLLSHDTAFYLSKDDFGLDTTGKYLLIGLREDKESIVPERAKRTFVSIVRKYFSDAVVKDVGRANSFEEYINIIKNSRIIVTDRLHVAILGALLGKRVYIVSNVYHKNRGVYEYSMSGKYDVSFYEVKELPKLLRDLVKVELQS